MTDASVKALVKNCMDIRHLYFVDVQRVTDLSLKALSQCRNLIVLNLADCIRYLLLRIHGAEINNWSLLNAIYSYREFAL